MDVLISAAELAQRLSSPGSTSLDPTSAGSDSPALKILDVRWSVAEPDGHPEYVIGHVPGAVFVDLDADLADRSVTGAGRHPLPSAAALQDSARRWGLNDGDTVVVYDDWNSQAASRAWWLLRAAGVADVRILDGGWAAWQRGDFPIDAGEASPEPGGIVIESLDGLAAFDADDVAVQALSPDAVVLDARATGRYRGDDEPLDSRAGHIPGALSAPTAENLTADGTFRPADELRERFAELGAERAPVTVYCGSGVTATHEIAALAIAGFDAALYPGSWSQWSSDPSRPVATGADPS